MRPCLGTTSSCCSRCSVFLVDGRSLRWCIGTPPAQLGLLTTVIFFRRRLFERTRCLALLVTASFGRFLRMSSRGQPRTGFGSFALLLYLWLAKARLGGADAGQELPFNVTAVATPEELSEAFAAESTHILITEHLDLTTLPLVGQDLGFDSALSSFEAPAGLQFLVVRSRLRSSDTACPRRLAPTAPRALQGNCTNAQTEPPAGTSPANDQCVVSVPVRFITWHEPTVTNDIWLGNLYVVHVGSESAGTLIFFFPMRTEGDATVTLWMPDITVDGGSRARGVFVLNADMFASGAPPHPRAMCAPVQRRSLTGGGFRAAQSVKTNGLCRVWPRMTQLNKRVCRLAPEPEQFRAEHRERDGADRGGDGARHTRQLPW